MEKPKNLYAQFMDMNRGRGLLEGMVVPGRAGGKGENWENCNSKINKIHLIFFLIYQNNFDFQIVYM